MAAPAPVNVRASWRRLVSTLESLRRRFPAEGDVTLTTSATTTTVNDRAMRADRGVDLTPTNANAASEDWYISDRSDGSFTITHANAGTTRTFRYRII